MIEICIKLSDIYSNDIYSKTIDVDDYDSETIEELSESLEDLLENYEDEICSIIEAEWEDDLSETPYYRDVIPQGVFDEEDYYVDVDDATADFLKSHHAQAFLIVDGKVIGNPIDLDEYISTLVAQVCGDGLERGDQICGLNIVRSLEEFVRIGKWTTGLRDENKNIITDITLWPKAELTNGKIIWKSSSGDKLEPIIWFGLDGEDPIECWTLSRDCNYLTAFSDGEDFPYYNWEMLIGELDNVVYWTFEELAESGPDPARIIDECPIQLYMDDVAKYVLSLQEGKPLPKVIKPRFRIENNVLKRYEGILKEVIIPEGVTEIGRDVFAGQKMESVIFPESLKEIDTDAFSNCKFLSTVTFSGNVEGIGSCAFASCVSLEYINLPDSLKGIGSFAFMGCSSLKRVRIPEHVSHLMNGTFFNCKSLSDVHVSEKCNVTAYKDTFEGCTNEGFRIVRYK